MIYLKWGKVANVAASRFVCSLETRVSPQNSLALEEALQAQQTLLLLRPVGTGTVVQDLCHILGLAQVVWDAAVPWAVRAFRAGARGIAVGVVVGIHTRRLEPPPQRLPLPKEEEPMREMCVVMDANIGQITAAMRLESLAHQVAKQRSAQV